MTMLRALSCVWFLYMTMSYIGMSGHPLADELPVAPTGLAAEDELVEQLSLPTFRVKLQEGLWTRLAEVKSQIKSNAAFDLDLTPATIEQKARTVAFFRSMELEKVAKELLNLKNQMFTDDVVRELDELRLAIDQAEVNFDELAKAFAADLLESRFVEELPFGGFRVSERAGSSASPIGVYVSTPERGEGQRENEERQREVGELMKQLSLPTFRANLETVIGKRLAEAEGQTESYDGAVDVASAKATIDREARAFDKLAELQTASGQLVSLKRSLLTGGVAGEIDELRRAIHQAELNFDELGKAFATSLLESRSVEELQFGGFRVLERSDVDVVLVAHTQVRDFNASVWLPRLLPWPPPDASARLVLPSALLRDQSGVLPATLGQLDDILQAGLKQAGYNEVGYLGVPTGFAIVTRLEQTTDVGQPLEGDQRWNVSIVVLRRFSLAEYLRALLTAPAGNFRILVFVISSAPFSSSGSVDSLESIENWSTTSVNTLPVEVRELKYHDGHRVTVLVYEFLKRHESDQPQATVPGHLTARDHLIRAGLQSLVEGK